MQFYWYAVWGFCLAQQLARFMLKKTMETIGDGTKIQIIRTITTAQTQQNLKRNTENNFEF